MNFNQIEAFTSFMETVYGLTEVSKLSMDEAIRVYYYAHKYRMDSLTEKLRKTMIQLKIDAIGYRHN